MSAVSTAAVSPQPPQSRLVALFAARPLLAALIVTALVTALRLVDTVDPDVAWQLWIAGRIHAGAHLYRDIIEVNPPLWFWMALPVDRMATLLHLRSEAVLIVGIGALVGLSLASLNRLLGDVAPARRTWALAFGALTLMAMPWMHVGQREQIVLIGTVPYAALIAARRQGDSVSGVLAILTGGGAALGFALKQYFLVVPVMLELWLLMGLGRSYRPYRPETVAIVAVGLAYAGAIFLFAPDWVTAIVPLIRLAYGATGAPALRYLFGPLALVAVVILCLCLGRCKALSSNQFAAALTVSAVGFAAAYFVQAKGWPYHAIPMLGCGSLALAILFGDRDGLPRTVRLFAPALLALPLFLAADDELHPALPSPDILDAISDAKSGETIAFLTTEPAFPWSVTLQRGFRYPSRYMGYWMMNAIIRNEHEGNPDPRLTALGRRVVTETVDDFLCSPPKRIIVWRPRPDQNGFDLLPFFERNTDFVALLSNYRVRGRTSFETYDQISALPAPRTACRTGV